MNIILEGPDGSGKSTLATHLSSVLGMPIFQGRGPVKPGTEQFRFDECRGMDGVIFDRHVCVSEMIYGPIFQRQAYAAHFYKYIYDGNHLIVYCRAPATALVDHVASSATDTPEYLAQLNTHFAQVVQRYDAWALENAHITYRRDSRNPAMAALINDLRGLHHEYMTWKVLA